MSTLVGEVVAFEREVGLGVVTSTDGGRYPFHCIEIADGTRDIDVGTEVTFELIAKLGRFEAARLTRT